MHLKLAAIVVCVVAVGTPGLAKESHVRKHMPIAAARGAGHRIAVTRAAANSRTAVHRGTVGAVLQGTKSGPRHQTVRSSPKHNKERESGTVTSLERESSVAPANVPADAVGWRLIDDSATGARLGLPEKLVPRAGASAGGSRWSSAQGQIQIETFRLAEAALPALFEEEKKAAHRQVESSVLKPDLFVIAGVQGLKNFLLRAEARGSEVRGIIILYDQATEGTMGRVARAMLGAFSGFPDPNAAPLPGMRRTVEYGTAIVVSGGGDLIAPARLTDECQAITVPGLGHAERVAEDKANDLALIRVYGARNLVPAILAGEAGTGGDIALVGVADPLVKAGGGEATKAAAHLTAQGIEPAPQPGFAGAAAVDPNGSLIGMIDVKPPVVAGGGSSSPGATLVPVAAISAFLQAQGIAPAVVAAEHPAMEQSVVRVICVRK
jgi:hypothetical protein